MFRIFFIFSARGRGRESSRPQEGGGGRFSIESPRRGGGRGWEAVCGAFGGGGGGGDFFFVGAEMPTKQHTDSFITYFWFFLDYLCTIKVRNI